jgi:micrococcal nuclease
VYEYNATVERVVDGDTVDLLIDLGFKMLYRHSCRLYGINANEHGTEAGEAAKAYLTQMLPVGMKVVVKTEKDKAEKYGRILGSLYLVSVKKRKVVVETVSINMRLVTEGHAKAWDGQGAKPV